MTADNFIDAPAEPVYVPFRDVSPDALQNLIESFVLREGTDYGLVDVAFDVKVAQVRRQLERNEARIVFDPESDSVSIVVV